MTKKSLDSDDAHADSSIPNVQPSEIVTRKSQDDWSSAGNAREQEEADAEPLAFLLAGITRSAILAVKRIGLSPQVVRSFLQRKAFMRVATSQSSSGKLELPTTTSKGPVNNIRAVNLGEIFKSSLVGLCVFGVYELTLSFDVWNEVPTDDSSTPVTMAADSMNPQSLQSFVYIQSPMPSIGDHVPLFGHVLAGSLAGLLQSLMTDVYELTTYWWHHRRSSSLFQSINARALVRRSVCDSIGFAALFGTYEAGRRMLEGYMFNFLQSGSPSVPKLLEDLHRFQIVSKDETSGSYDTTVLSMSAALVAGGIAGQTHLVVNHYTHHLWLRPTTAHRAKPSSRHYFPKPPQLGAVAGAFVPAALCFLALRHGGQWAERWLGDDGAEGGDRPRHKPSSLIRIPIHHVPSP